MLAVDGFYWIGHSSPAGMNTEAHLSELRRLSPDVAVIAIT